MPEPWDMYWRDREAEAESLFGPAREALYAAWDKISELQEELSEKEAEIERLEADLSAAREE